MKYHYLFYLWLILCACGPIPEETQPDQTLTFPSDCQTNLLTEMDFKFIPLESNEELILGSITQIDMDEGRLFVLDPYQNKALYVFSEEGKFITQVGGVGQGPGEYSMPNSFILDKKDQCIIIRDLQRNQLLYYDLKDYTFRQKKTVPFYFNSFQPMENDRMAWFFTGGIDEDWYVSVTDTTFKQTSGHYFKADFKSGNSLLLASCLYNLQEKTYVYHPQKPFIYRIDAQELHPVYRLKIENADFPPAEFLQKEESRSPHFTQALAASDYIATYSLFENKKGFIISYLAKKTPFIGLYRKDTRETVNYGLLEFTKMMQVDGMSQPLGCTDLYFISTLSPHTLQTRYPRREALQKLKEETQADDNPIVCLYNFN